MTITYGKLSSNMKLGEVFFDKMDSVLKDLRADFDVASSGFSKRKVNELKQIHVDTTGKVSTLSNLATGSNGIISGLRGTGKSHLMLLSREKINNRKQSLCIYIDLKNHLNIGGNIVVEERFYVWALLKQLKLQMAYLIQDTYEEDSKGFFQAVISYFSKDKQKEIEKKVETILNELNQLILLGEQEVQNLAKTKSLNVQQEKSVLNNSSLKAEGSATSAKVEAKAEHQNNIKNSLATTEESSSTILLDIDVLKRTLVSLVELLGLKSIVFFYDEWSLLNRTDQDILANLIRSLSTAPIYHWIAIIPYKSSLGVLETTSDMVHKVDLDLQFIFEENNSVCTNYFKEFMNKRLDLEFGNSSFTIDKIVRPQFFELIVKASMGNTRDFGLMLYKAWELFKQDYLVTKNKRIIAKKHIVKAIKSLADEKFANLENRGSKYSEKLWSEIIKFVGLKKHTHFCIEQNSTNLSLLKEDEYTDLLYYRLIHLRKKDVPAKDGGEWRLSTYSVDVSAVFSRIFETNSERTKIKLVTDMEIVHDQIRRYTFDLASIINEFRMEQGKQIKCLSCGKIITGDMKYAWDNKVCIFCSQPLPMSR
ncbi:hypothetical protein [Brevibacillus sp. SIMBA_040]|uniref:hypothetical protein n=1 Tax=unclassified Brevibacillus TaxID=2684853 RepID=UPI00397B80A2